MRASLEHARPYAHMNQAGCCVLWWTTHNMMKNRPSLSTVNQNYKFWYSTLERFCQQFLSGEELLAADSTSHITSLRFHNTAQFHVKGTTPQRVQTPFILTPSIFWHVLGWSCRHAVTFKVPEDNVWLTFMHISSHLNRSLCVRQLSPVSYQSLFKVKFLRTQWHQLRCTFSTSRYTDESRIPERWAGMCVCLCTLCMFKRKTETCGQNATLTSVKVCCVFVWVWECVCPSQCTK